MICQLSLSRSANQNPLRAPDLCVSDHDSPTKTLGHTFGSEGLIPREPGPDVRAAMWVLRPGTAPHTPSRHWGSRTYASRGAPASASAGPGPAEGAEAARPAALRLPVGAGSARPRPGVRTGTHRRGTGRPSCERTAAEWGGCRAGRRHGPGPVLRPAARRRQCRRPRSGTPGAEGHGTPGTGTWGPGGRPGCRRRRTRGFWFRNASRPAPRSSA